MLAFISVIVFIAIFIASPHLGMLLLMGAAIFHIVRHQLHKNTPDKSRGGVGSSGPSSSSSAGAASRSIPREVRLAVWQRDGGRCKVCHGTQDLEFDHIIPFSWGGATTVGNLQLLCRACNRHKGASLG